MLNDEKKALIEAEEHYRHEVARKLRADLDAVALAALNRPGNHGG